MERCRSSRSCRRSYLPFSAATFTTGARQPYLFRQASFSSKWLKQLSLCGLERGSIGVHQSRCGILDATRNALVSSECCNQPRRRDMLPSTMDQVEVLAAPSKLPPPPGPVWKQPSEDSDASGEDELEQSFQSFKSEEMTTSSSSAEGMKNQDVTEYLREQARHPPQSHARDPAHHATRVRCHRTASCRSQSSQRSWRASCPT